LKKFSKNRVLGNISSEASPSPAGAAWKMLMRLKTILCAALAVPAALVYPCSAATALAGSDAPAMRQESHVMSQVEMRRAKKLDEVVESYYNSGKFEGVALVVGDGNVLLKKAYGLANREWSVPNTVTTRFNIASLAKSFTAILIMQLQQEGKLQLDDNLATYLPQYTAEAGQKVTLRQLLTPHLRHG
jgi:CubicO group peptidase (beta-lactamase class C family)